MAEAAFGTKDAYQAVSELIYTYAERLDLGDYEGVADLFAGAVITRTSAPDVSRGREEVLARYTAHTRKHADGTPRTKHMTTNLIVDVDDTAGMATARSYFCVLQHVAGEFSLQPIIAGRYHDRFERVDGRWRFAARHIISELVGDLSHHLLDDDRVR
jgi:3-phenylpropionate/cinnamic acid dioxygenase small subunit